MAMILKAWGVEANPLTLNRHMISMAADGYTQNGGVKWEALNGYPGNGSVRYNTQVGKARKDGGAPIALNSVDPYLNDQYSVIGEVRNWSSREQKYHTHFVVISEKTTEGQYLIVDPGPSMKPRLSDYEGILYRVILYKRKK
ncbi:MAG: hypothetical protein IPI01_18025 [Ignavibacteriae bacterium]|nr:hypothetical protein [Ignavibacteriota bacterium]